MEETYLKNSIDTAGLRAQYDKHAKAILKDKSVLAHILVGAVEEFSGYTIEEAMSCISGEPEVSTYPVRPSAHVPEAISGDAGENNIQNEGKVFFDILFHVYMKNGERTKIYINVEAQADLYLGYEIPTRGVVYGARNISGQMDVEYTPTSYDGVKKVYSIWLCFNSPDKTKEGKKSADTIVRYSMKPEVLYNSDKEKEVDTGRYDLITVVTICLSEKTVNSSNELIGMLSTLFSTRMPVSSKEKILEEKHGLPMTREFKEEVNVMCNISKTIAVEETERADKAEARAEKAEKEAAERAEKAAERTILNMYKNGIEVDMIAKIIEKDTAYIEAVIAKG